ncbi:HAD family hydrolase [Leifsonia poae]|uniref:HAD family hydrolase n=1 Tax=Leifsonia poae TaxID=110933 RepID=UPI001CC0BD1E|nr:HAD hydrolase-like protein [Leifsonia poae]
MSGRAVVLFDWNGTVVLDRERARDALNGVLGARRLPRLSEEGFRRRFRLPMAEMFEELGVRTDSTDAAEAEWNSAMAAAPAGLRRGAIPGLEALAGAGVRLGVISAAHLDAVAADQHAHGLTGMWSSVDAPVIDKLAVLQRRRGSETVAAYVGDTVYDIECAREAGYLAVGVRGGYTASALLTAAGADALIDGIDEIAALIGAASMQASAPMQREGLPIYGAPSRI